MIKRPREYSRLIYLGVGLLTVLWFTAPLFREPFAWGSTRDWGYFTFLEEVTRKTVLEFHQFPLWNPYYFGGAEHLANPQSCVLSPTTLLLIPLGTALGFKVAVVIFALLGTLGMYHLARHWGADPAGSLVSGLLYGCSGFFAQHVGGGHWGFAAVSLYPLAALFYLKSLRDPRMLVAALFMSAWVAVHWGIYTLPWLFMILLMVAVNESFRTKRIRPLLALMLLVVLTLALTAVRLLPVLEYVQRFPRAVTETDHLGLDDLLYMLFGRHTTRDFPGHPWEWPEYGSYLGWAAAALLLISFRLRFERKLMLWVGSVIFLALALGKFADVAPFALLHRLPLLENLRVPSRYTVLALFFLAPLAGLSLTALTTRLREWAKANWQRWLVSSIPIAAVVLILVDPVAFNRQQFEQSFHLPPPTDDVSPTFEQRRGDPARMYAYPRCNQGSVLGLEESPLPLAPAIRIDATYQYLLAQDSAARIEPTWWSPNELRFHVNAPDSNLLVVNQNFRREWKVEGRGVLENHRGLLAVSIPAGEQVVALYYQPTSVVVGSVISLLTGVGLAAWWSRRRKNLWQRR